MLLARTAGHPARVVGGFVGGRWNTDHITVSNSDAHAWCEIFDGRGSWMRVDPTAAAGGGDVSQDLLSVQNGSAGLRDAEDGWTSRMDRLRLFWYRRIVSFDQSDQRVLAASLKEGAQEAGKNLKELAHQVLTRARAWIERPWSGGRSVWAAGLCAGLVVLWWGWRRRGRAWWLNWRSVRGGGIDPVRREAGRWLRRLRDSGRDFR
ncbi:MAG: transglutaminase-like domain-containing protein [Nibricoccus sp.]